MGHRILIYSHDSFGLGHLRRCRTIAHALVRNNPDYTVLILTGSSLFGAYDFHPNVDYIRIPGILKTPDGGYTAHNLHDDLDQAISLRQAIIRETARNFKPDLFLVDKEPLGLRGEVRPALEDLNKLNIPCVLGLRDVMDNPKSLAQEWQRKGAYDALDKLYQHIWVFGLKDFFDPLAGLPLSSNITDKITFTGYLPRGEGLIGTLTSKPETLIVTPGGGGDGALMVDWVLRAYETATPDQRLKLPPAHIILGPFMDQRDQTNFFERAAALDLIKIIDFDAKMISLIAKSAGVVAMGGYNIFCEALSFNKPTLLIPRTQPRQEQLIRAKRATDLGLANFLDPAHVENCDILRDKLISLINQSGPLDASIPSLLSGLDNINKLVQRLMVGHSQPKEKLDA